MSALKAPHEVAPPGPKYQVVNGQVTREIVVHIFEMYTDQDTILAAGEPLFGWQQSAAGKWILEHAVEKPRWIRHSDPLTFFDKFAILARLSEADIIYFKLKYE